MGRIAIRALAVFFGTLALCDVVFAQELLRGYASPTVTRFSERGDVLGRLSMDSLPPIPPGGIKAERVKMGLVRVQIGSETFFFNHSQLEMTGTIPAELKGSCNKVRSAPGDKRNTNIGMGLGGCN